LTTELVKRRQVGEVCVLTLNRPAVRNALSFQLFRQLRGHVDDIGRHVDTVGSVIVNGAGSCFSAGNDMKDTEFWGDPALEELECGTIDAIEALPQPVIASVHGYCLTGALELVLACDLLVVAESAHVADTHARWGMLPMWGMSQRLPRRVGIVTAREMMFTGRPVLGPECVRIGLANSCVPDDELEQATIDLAEECLQNSWWSLRNAKRLLRASADYGLADGLDAERRGQHTSPDFRERMRGFLERPRRTAGERSPKD
jgi:enoyl-CoA hydratase